MGKPIIAGNRPKGVELERGESCYYCTCGKSSKQPFCDGSHKGSSFKPQSYVAEQTAQLWFCTCKHTKNPPFCDGAHKVFSADQIGCEGPGD